MFKATRSSAKWLAEKTLVTLSSWYSPRSTCHSSLLAFSKFTVEEGHCAMLDVCAVGTMGALGPACLLFSAPSLRVDCSKLFRQENRHTVCLP